MSGSRSYHAGLAAEAQVARRYTDGGATVLAERWRGAGGEIDLIVEEDGVIVFVEVKKSSDHDIAALRLGADQILRLQTAAAEFLESRPKGALTDCRFDVALLDEAGRIEILRNAIIG